MTWYAWLAVAWMITFLAFASYAVGWLTLDRFRARRAGRSAERFDDAFARLAHIDLSRTVEPRFLGRRR